MTRSRVERGDAALHRLRVFFSLLLFPFAVYAFIQSGWMSAEFGDLGEEIWDLFCFGLALAGLSIRALDAGFPDEGKSAGRGIHLLVRYPLFFANVLIFLSVVLLFKSPLFTVLAAGAATVYYRRRIALEDEKFAAAFGEAALQRARDVPAFLPKFTGWISPASSFSWKAFLQSEAGPMTLVGGVFFVMEALEGTVIENHTLKFWIVNEPHWFTILLASGAVFAWRAIHSPFASTPRFGMAGEAGAISFPGTGTSGAGTLPAKIGEILDWISRTHVRAVSALLIGSFVILLPGFSSLPVTSRDESRFAQPAKQMVETGDYIDIRLQDAARYRKPIGIYWLQAAAVNAAEAIGIDNARNRIEIYRIPSLLAAIGSVLLTYWIALAFVRRRYALLAGGALAASGLLGVEARIATIDASMLLASTAAFGSLAYVYLNRERAVSRIQAWSWAGIFWTAIGASLLLKGPIILTILALALVALIVRDRSVSWLLKLKPLAGILWVALMIAPWYLAIYLQTKGAFFQRSVSGDLMSRLLQPAEGHWGPPGYFWLLFWVSFWPAAIFAPQATAFAWINRSDKRIFFLIAWIVPAWIMFELVVTKLPHYVLPLYPAIAILIACLLDRRIVFETKARAVGLLWPLFAGAMAAAICYFAYKFDGQLGPVFFLASALAIGLASYAAWNLWRGETEAAFVVVLLAAFASSTALYIALPQMKGFALARELVTASRSAPCALPRLASAGYHEPNLVFYGGTDTVLATPAGAADFLQVNECRVAFVEQRAQTTFAERAAAIGLGTEKIAEVSGFDYSNWRHVSFDVLVRK